MKITAPGARRRVSIAILAGLVALGAALAASAGSPAAGTPAKVKAELRIEGPKRALDRGTTYRTGTERIKRSKGLRCKHRRGRVRVPGATALGILKTASERKKRLRPVRVRTDDFGLFVCEVAGIIGRPFDHPRGFSGWTYWVNYAAGTQAAELQTLQPGDQVLWVFSDFGKRNINTGDALELTGVPETDPDGRFRVQVVSHAFDGTPSPRPGARIKGAKRFRHLGGGTYRVRVGKGRSTLYAKRKPDIPSNRERVVVK